MVWEYCEVVDSGDGTGIFCSGSPWKTQNVEFYRVGGGNSVVKPLKY